MKKKIVLMDDEEKFCKDMKSFLEMKGYEAFTALNGEDGLRLVETEEPDLVMMDLHMPRIGGSEVMKRIRKIRPRLPVMVVSGSDEIEIRRKIGEAGEYFILRKPFKLAQLLQVLQKYVPLTDENA